jgi:hypothetical protein
VSDETLTHEQALALIDGRIGEEVYVGFLYASDSGTDDLQPVQHFQGKLENPLDPRPPRLDGGHGFYEIGMNSFGLPPMTGTVHLRDNGIDFQVADGAMIRIAWRGSSEVGDWRPTREDLARLNEVGIKLPEHEKPDVNLPTEANKAGE